MFDVWYIMKTIFVFNLSLKVPCHLLPREGFGSATDVVFPVRVSIGVKRLVHAVEEYGDYFSRNSDVTYHAAP